MNEAVDLLHGISVSHCLSYGPILLFFSLSASVIGQPGNFALPAVVGSTGIALLSRSVL